MSGFSAKTSEMSHAGQQEAEIANDLARIEQKINDVLNNLQINSSSAYQIRNALRTDLSNVSSLKGKLRVLSSTLEEIAQLYQQTEDRITGGSSTSGSVKSSIREVAKDIAVVAEKCGVDSASAYSNDPVNLCNGNYVYEKTCIELETEMQMRFRIFYNIQNGMAGAFGRGWTHTWEILLEDEPNRFVIRKDDASQLIFYKQNGEIVPAAGTFGSLSETGTGYVYNDRSQTWYYFDTFGRLVREEDFGQNHIELTYNEIGRLCMVEDNHGNFFRFGYDQNGKLIFVEDHGGRRVEFTYKNDLVESLQDALGRTVHYQYDENGWLTELVNGRGITGLCNQYDPQGRTVCQKFPDGGVVTYKYLGQENQVRMTEQNGNVVVYEHDGLMRNIRNIYGNGEEVFTYNDNNQRTSFTDKRGFTSYYEYDKNGNLTGFRTPLGDKVRIEYTHLNQVQSVSLNGMVLHEAFYDEGNLQVKVKNALGFCEYFEYDEHRQPVRWTKADGSQIEMEYDDYGNLTMMTNSMGGRMSYEYDEYHRVIRTVDGLGYATEYAYNDSDALVAVKNAQGHEQRYAYDDCGNMVSMVDFNGGIVQLEYNALNKPVKMIDQDGHVSYNEYDEMWNVTCKTNPDGGKTVYEYDKYQHLVQVTDPNGAVNRMEYDACGNLIRRTDPNGGVHSLEYDGLNRPVRVTDPCGFEVKAEYDALGNVTAVRYADGSAEEYEYDAAGQIIAATDRAGYRKEYRYNLLGKITEVSDEGGWLEKYEYYPGGLIKSELGREGSGRQYEYDLNENIVAVTNQDGSRWDFTYDELGRVLKVEGESDLLEAYEYDEVGNITAVIAGDGTRTAYTYSMGGVMESATDPLGNETKYVYDGCQRLIKILQSEDGSWDAAAVNELNRQQKKIRMTVYERDAVGNIIRATDPAGNATVYTYDGCGNILSKLDPDGYLTSCEYNKDGTESRYSFADGRSILLSYNERKQLVQLQDWNGITKIESDILGRPVKVETPNQETVEYERGIRGELKTVVYPDKERAEYFYDEGMRLSSLKVGAAQVKYDYYSNGRLKEKDFPEGFCTQYKYNSRGKISEICHRKNDQILHRIFYQYDRTGRKSLIERIGSGEELDGRFEYTYNALGSLASVSRNGVMTESYQYDKFGNRTWAWEEGKEIQYTYNSLNQLVSMRDMEGEHSFTYDRRGNLTEEVLNGTSVLNLKFGPLGLLSTADAGNKRAVYQYDGFGKRTGRRSWNEQGVCRKERYLHDITRDFHSLLGVSDGEDRQNIFWDEGLLGSSHESELNFYMNDERMSPQRVICGTDISAAMQYGTFGNLPQSSGNLFGFTGYRPDDVTGFLHAGAREYDPKKGRFISLDPNPGMITVPLSLNAYSYCMGDPMNYHDPTGRIVAWLAGGIIGTVTNVVTKAAGDVVESVATGKVQVSSWQSYVGAAAGGFTSGTVFVVSGGNMAAAGAAGSAVESFTTGGLSMVTGAEGYRKEDGYSWKNLFVNTAVDAAKGGASGFVFGEAGKYIKIPGINKGRGSFQAVWKQVMTKASNGTIANVTMKTMFKGLTAYGGVKFLDTLVSKGIKTVKDTIIDKGFTWIKDQFVGEKKMPAEVNAKTYLSANVIGAQCPAEGG